MSTFLLTRNTTGRILLLFLVILMGIGVLYGQTSRLPKEWGGTARNISLGGAPANPFLDDYLRVHVNPAFAFGMTDIVWSDLGYQATDCPYGGSDAQNLGAVFNVMESKLALGVIFNKRESPLYGAVPFAFAPPNAGARLGASLWEDPVAEVNGLLPGGYSAALGTIQRPLPPVEVLGAMHLNSLDLGLSITMSGWSSGGSDAQTAPPSDASVSSRIMRFKFGAAYTFNSDMVFDGAFLLGMNSVSGSGNQGAAKFDIALDDGKEMGFDGRLTWKYDEATTFVPIVRWYKFGFGAKDNLVVAPAVSPANNYSHSQLQFGFGVRRMIGSALFVGGVSYLRVKQTDENVAAKTTTENVITDLPQFNVGIEAPVTDWLLARFGYFERFSSTKRTLTGTNLDRSANISDEARWNSDLNALSAANQRLTIGAGLRFGNFSFDGLIGEGFLINGPWFASGNAQEMFGMLSAHIQL